LSVPGKQGQTSPSSKTTARSIPGREGKGRECEEQEESAWRLELDEGVGKVEVLERWMNLAPVKDFCVVEEEGRGLVSASHNCGNETDEQSHLVVASGASTANSLRVVRSGVGLEEVIAVEGLEAVERMWTISSPGG
jgi:DNA damage-binding protein 1